MLSNEIKGSDFLAAVRWATLANPARDEMPEWLQPAPQAAAGSDEHGTYSGPAGGFLVPPHLSRDLLRAETHDPTSGFVRLVEMEAPATHVPARFDDEGRGLLAFRRAEANRDEPTRAEFGEVALNASTMSAVCFATEEVLESTFGTFAEVLATTAREQFQWMALKEKLRGTGVGEPMGVINSACTIEVAKENMQAADTINGTNITKMASRCWQYENAIWLGNPDTLPQLLAAHVAGTNGDRFLLEPADPTSGAAFNLAGRPLFFSEHCSTLGDKGDLILGNWGEYLWGVERAFAEEQSLHVRFVSHQRAFRFYSRSDGAPWWRAPITPAHGTATLSPFVTLATRS